MLVLKYIVIDYEKPKLKTAIPIGGTSFKQLDRIPLLSSIKKFWRNRRFEKQKSYDFLQLERKEITWQDRKIIYLIVPLYPKNLSELPIMEIQKQILCSLYGFPEKERVFFRKLGKNIFSQKKPRSVMLEDEFYLLEVQKKLEDCVPNEIPRCEDQAEIYKNVFQEAIENLSKYGYIQRRSARLLFLDDGSREAKPYIQSLSKDWNYVSVYSNRHKELEELYQNLYEEEGLMIECIGPERKELCRGEVVIDLTKEWKGIHRIYPEGSHVLDVTFSHEKEEYLRVKKAKISGYLQAANFKELHF